MSFISEAMDTWLAGGSFQKELLKRLCTDHCVPEEAAEMLAVAVGEFKTKTEEWIRLNSYEVKSDRKRANNIINDISRTCRKELGYTIKLKSRKDGYVYESSLAETKPKLHKGTDIAKHIIDDSLLPDPSKPNNLMEELKYTLQKCIEAYGIDETGQVCVAVLKSVH